MIKKIYGVYRIICLINNRIYIGGSSNIKRRKYIHFYLLRKGTHFSLDLQKDFNEFGEDKFIFEIIKETNDCYSLEHKLIKELQPFYNKTYIVEIEISHRTRERLLNKVIKMDNGCWQMNLYDDKKYPHVMLGSRPHTANRVFYYIFNGDFDLSQFV